MHLPLPDSAGFSAGVLRRRSPRMRLSHPHFVLFLRMERHFSPSHPQFAPFLRMERRRLASCPALPASTGFSRTVGACLMFPAGTVMTFIEFFRFTIYFPMQNI